MSRIRNKGVGDELSFDGFDDSRGKGEQILEALTELIRQQRPGALLPSERLLAEEFGVARMTVRQCVDDLAKQGLVKRIPGRGTFVREPRLIHSDVFRSFSDDMRLRGMEPGTRRLSTRIKPAGAEVASRLGIRAADKVYLIERVRTADGEAMALERTNIPCAPFPGLDTLLDMTSSLYDVLGRHFGVRLETAEQSVRIVRLSAADAGEIQSEPDEPAFLVERASRDSMGTVIEFGRSLYRADRYEILMQVHRPEASG